MTHLEFRELLSLLMLSDPEPIPLPALKALAEKEALARGFDEWVVAYHEFDPADARFNLEGMAGYDGIKGIEEIQRQVAEARAKALAGFANCRAAIERSTKAMADAADAFCGLGDVLKDLDLGGGKS